MGICGLYGSFCRAAAGIRVDGFAMAAALQWWLLRKLGQTASALDEQEYIQSVQYIIYI
jgi:hypothetical protein